MRTAHSTSTRTGCPRTRSTWIRSRTTRWPSWTPTARRWPGRSTPHGTGSAEDLPGLTVPTLAVHGVADPIAPIGAVQAYAEQIEPLQLKEFAGGHHDILNDTMHREVASAIIAFIGEKTGESPARARCPRSWW